MSEYFAQANVMCVVVMLTLCMTVKQLSISKTNIQL